MNPKIQDAKSATNGPEESAIDPDKGGMIFFYIPYPEKKDVIVLRRKAIEPGVTFFETEVLNKPYKSIGR